MQVVYHSGDWQYQQKNEGIFDYAVQQYLDFIKKDMATNALTNKDCVQVIVGDIFEKKMKTSVDEFIKVKQFFDAISELSPVIVTIGNHDYNEHNLERGDMLTKLFSNVQFNNVTYYRDSCIFEHGNIRFFNISKYEDNKFPDDWQSHLKKDKFNVGLFHDPLREAVNFDGYALFGNKPSADIFTGLDCVMMADIHKRQSISIDGFKWAVYCGSPYQLNYGEKHDGHGIVKWVFDDSIVFDFVDLKQESRFLKVEKKDNAYKILN